MLFARRLVCVLSFVLALAGGLLRAQSSAPAIDKVNALLAEVATLYRAEKYRAAVEPWTQAKSALDELRGSDTPADLRAAIEPLERRWQAAGRLLVAHGQKLAGFDAARPADIGPLAKGSPPKPLATPKPPAPSPLPSETPAANGPSFLRDVAPLFVANCTGCHGGMRTAADLRLTTFEGLTKGGQSGPIVEAKKAADSLLVKKLKGTAGERMPIGRPPLSDQDIAKVEAWIDAGAKYDGEDAKQSLPAAISAQLLGTLSHEGLAAKRMELADRNWQLAALEAKPAQAQTENFTLIGNVPPARLKEIGAAAEAEWKKVSRPLKAALSKPLVKGRLTLFLFKNHADYAEFGRMVESRDTPKERTAHWRVAGVDAYAGLVAPSDDVSPALLAEQIVGAYVDSLGASPRWFVVGTARAIAARTEPKDPAVKRWEADLQAARASGRAPAAFLTSDAVDEASAALSYGFVKFLMTGAARYTGLLESLRKGAEFDPSLAKLYGGDAKSLVGVWVRQGGR